MKPAAAELFLKSGKNKEKKKKKDIILNVGKTGVTKVLRVQNWGSVLLFVIRTEQHDRTETCSSCRCDRGLCDRLQWLQSIYAVQHTVLVPSQSQIATTALSHPVLLMPWLPSSYPRTHTCDAHKEDNATKK